MATSTKTPEESRRESQYFTKEIKVVTKLNEDALVGNIPDPGDESKTILCEAYFSPLYIPDKIETNDFFKRFKSEVCYPYLDEKS